MRLALFSQPLSPQLSSAMTNSRHVHTLQEIIKQFSKKH